jgi:hypothetical protein
MPPTAAKGKLRRDGQDRKLFAPAVDRCAKLPYIQWLQRKRVCTENLYSVANPWCPTENSPATPALCVVDGLYRDTRILPCLL